METAPKTGIREVIERLQSALPIRIPHATYRLQFNGDFTFRDAVGIVRYLDALGVTDIYASPYLKAREGSTHGYDIVDHHQLNPDVGTREDYDALTTELRRHGMGQVLDIVPNHMSISSRENPWWRDVLENGPSSPYASYFDVDWKPVKAEMEDKVIIPILGDHYGRVLERQELTLAFKNGGFSVSYYDHVFPLDPCSYIHVVTHRLPVLEKTLGEDSSHYRELLSIITALTHLPARTDSRPELIAERLREKEIIKERLRHLYTSCPPFREFLDTNVAIFNGTRHVRGSFDLLDGLLSAQSYRLTFWRVATEEINYRRFFDINDLAAIRTENPEVFQETHGLVLDLVRAGAVTGLRVDHPDGLQNPKDYFRRLQEECFIVLCLRELGEEEADNATRECIRRRYREDVLRGSSPASPLYVVGEKILMRGERLPDDWPICGTTGYSFMNAVGGLFVDTDNEKAMDRTFATFTGQKVHYETLVYEKKKLIMQSSMAGEMNVLGHRLNRISESHRDYRDFTLNSLTDAIVEVIACFPVYRTYIDSSEVAERDRRIIGHAVALAKRHRRDLGTSIFDFIHDVLTLRCPDILDEAQQKEWLAFTMTFQQLTGPVMAKGLEDTVFYLYNRLGSLNEVGGAPDVFGISPEAFHGQNLEVQDRWPWTLRATSTHDCKRSEDVRARISVISELPREWRDCLRRWTRLNRKLKTVMNGTPAPDRSEEYLLYQTLLGTWPVGPVDGPALSAFTDRITRFMVKALREGKANSNWLNPDTEYEEAVSRFVQEVLASPLFRADFEPFRLKLSHHGMLNSLSQTLLKITSPGVPDFYQGTELWHFRLVDPDNREPVDYEERCQALESIRLLEQQQDRARLAEDLIRDKDDGRIKLYLTTSALRFRRENARLFRDGRYVPLDTHGGRHRNALGFARTLDPACAITAVTRLTTQVTETEFGLPAGHVWKGTLLSAPAGRETTTFRDVFTGRSVRPVARDGRHVLPLEDVFSILPVALLEEVPSS